MESSSFCGASNSEEDKSLARCNSNSNSSLADRVSVDEELSNGLKEKLNVDVGNITNNTYDVQRRHIEESYIDDFEDEDEDEDDFSKEAILAQMGYRNELDEEEEKSEPPPEHKLITTTPLADLNLVSALKGSRAKEGKPDMECRVSWSPDVYDQPYTPPEHFATDKIERHKSEYKVKGVERRNKQKGGSKGYGASEGKGGRKDKDKKRGKKRGGNSSRHSGYDED